MIGFVVGLCVGVLVNVALYVATGWPGFFVIGLGLLAVAVLVLAAASDG